MAHIYEQVSYTVPKGGAAVKQDIIDATRGQRASVIAGLLGLIPALGLGSLRFINGEPPEVSEELAGNIVFALVMVAPYLLALAVARIRIPAARGGLLLALGMLSLAATFSALSGVTVILFPATVALIFAAFRSLWGTGPQIIRIPLFLAPGLLGAAAIAFGFYALFQLGADEPRCWMLTMVEGREEWQSMAVPPRSETGSMRMGPFGPEVKKAICTSDIITNQEAALGLAGVGAGFLVLIAISRLRLPGRQRGQDGIE